jgi:hypothetical protein
MVSSRRSAKLTPTANGRASTTLLIGFAPDVVSLLWLSARTNPAQGTCLTARNLDPSALRGDAAEGDWLSAFFPLPSYPEGLSTVLTAVGSRTLMPRGVPDLAGGADELTGYDVRSMAAIRPGQSE